MFHVTPVKNVDNIFRTGLIPAIGPRSIALGETTKGIYLFPDMNSLMDASWLEDYFDDDELAVLEIDTTGLNITKTFGEDSWEVIIKETIPPKNITIRNDLYV